MTIRSGEQNKTLVRLAHNPVSESPSPQNHVPHVKFLPDPQTSKTIPEIFQIESNRASDVPEQNDDIHPALEEVEAAKLFTGYIHTNQVRCPTPKPLGELDKGGWDVCITPPFNLQRNCTVYSFGVGRAWGFDDAVSTEYQCNVYAFDPTINKEQHTRLERIYFFPIGLGGEKQNTLGKKKFPLQTYKQFLERFNHTQTVIDILKIDIEYSEWASLDSMIHDGSLVNVKQLQLEIHTEEVHKERSTTAHFVYYWRLLRNLHKLGFRLWGCHDNPYGPFMKHVLPERKISCCYELYFINQNFFE